jgi:adenine-specific DNA-methyltransferase
MKFRRVFLSKDDDSPLASQYRWVEFANGIRKIKTDLISEEKIKPYKLWRPDNLTSSHEYSLGKIAVEFEGNKCLPGPRHWTTSPEGFQRLKNAKRLCVVGNTLSYVRYLDDFLISPLLNVWTDTGTGGYGDTRYYVVQTTTKVIQRCLLMTTDPGDLVLDPTCGSGTTAYVSEQWGRRWITIDTSRVALALARARLMGARYPYYLLADSAEGQLKEAELRQTIPLQEPTYNRIRHGFVYERVPTTTLKSIANNTEIDVIYEKYRDDIENALQEINVLMQGENVTFKIETGIRKGRTINFNHPAGKVETLSSGETVSGNELLEWEVSPLREMGIYPPGFEKVARSMAKFWDAKLKCQREIDASIAAKADFENLYDKPYEDNKKIRVAGPFTVESISPHKTLDLDENGDFITDRKLKVYNRKGQFAAERAGPYEEADFTSIILENLRTAGVQQAHKEDKINFTSLNPWPGSLVCAEGRYDESGEQKNSKPIQRRAAIFIGGEFGTVTRADLVEAANQAAEANFDCLIACAFNYEARVTDFNKLGKIRILKARMNADLHMADDLRNTGKGNLFVIFGEPDLEILTHKNNQIAIKIRGVDVFHPSLGKVESSDTSGIACWFIDTDYNGESFFVRHAYFLGVNNPYESLKNTLNTQINEDVWASLHSDTSQPFDKPATGCIAVKVINHLGDAVMKVINVNK